MMPIFSTKLRQEYARGLPVRDIVQSLLSSLITI